MKTLVFTLAMLPAVLSAQRRAPLPVAPRPAAPAAPVTGGALGGSFLSPGFSRPLGGITPAKTPVVPTGRRSAARYVGPVIYVPNAFDSFGSYAAAPYAAEGVAAARAERPADAAAPVIVNQYFGSNERDYSRTEFQSSSARPTQEASVAAGDPIAPTQNYYLIVYKDHSIYSALAYWLEDGTLHYVTTQNTHNQASLGLIDLEQTTKLNADHAVPFSISR